MLDSAELLERCTFPTVGTEVVCAFSGGADSTALIALAQQAGCVVHAVHVHHGLRASADDDADLAAATAHRLGIPFRLVYLDLADGPNLEARARDARRLAVGQDAMTGHTMEDQAETVLLALLRGAGATGLGGISPGWRHPILALRRAETVALCNFLGLPVADDPTNTDPRFRRNRVRHEALPLLDAIADRDVTPLLARTADLARQDDLYLEELAARLDPTDAEQLASAHRAVASRAVRLWLTTVEGYPPDASAVDRVLGVARGQATACEVAGGMRVERHGNRLQRCPSGHTSS